MIFGELYGIASGGVGVAIASVLKVHSDAAFDTHYVNGQGKEISLQDAVKATKKSTSDTK